MNSYIIKINPIYKDKLEEIGLIEYSSKIIEGLYCISSNKSTQDLQKLEYIENVELESIGSFDV